MIFLTKSIPLTKKIDLTYVNPLRLFSGGSFDYIICDQQFLFVSQEVSWGVGLSGFLLEAFNLSEGGELVGYVCGQLHGSRLVLDHRESPQKSLGSYDEYSAFVPDHFTLNYSQITKTEYYPEALWIEDKYANHHYRRGGIGGYSSFGKFFLLLSFQMGRGVCLCDDVEIRSTESSRPFYQHVLKMSEEERSVRYRLKFPLEQAIKRVGPEIEIKRYPSLG